jgi:hypothetical protein
MLGASMIAFGTPAALLYSYHTVRSPRFSALAGFALFTAVIFTLPFLFLLGAWIIGATR